ncbi:MAG TPA: hypothetical protein VFL90_19705 [Methylomirabilota bacterium]|nr:hypothetical protein [Methylomirabilota bacterium]
MRALALAALLALALAHRAEAALPAPPFTLDVDPTRPAAGQPVTIVVTPRGDAGVFDVYLMWALSAEAGFLGADGAWSPRPLAFRAGVPATGAPIVMRWVPGPGSDIPLALVVVPAGADPLARFGWTYRPALVRIAVQAPPARAPLDLRALAPVAVAALVACAIVLLAGKPFLG